MPRITIGSTVIDFPNSGRDANWSPAVIQFAESVAEQLQAISSAFDIGSRTQTLTSDANTNLDIDGATFPNGSVRKFDMDYAIYRTNSVDAVVEAGHVIGVYDTLDSVWVLSHQFNGDVQTDGTQYTTFQMSGDQLQLSTVAIGGSYDGVASKISYSTRTQLVSS